ncbi:MAG: response regulator, partial [Acetobacteraceae bacterium]|nr:response regulator [Acetobacteraceae bacterium]
MAAIVLIDDDASALASASKILRASGHYVEAAAGGRIGLKTFAAIEPDLLITDIFMPECDGLEVIRA